jgi:glucosamine--fructose-6-phosphate aminotransferase (isomerizing)
VTGAQMRAEMLEQPAALRRLAGRFDDHVAAVRAVVRRPLSGVVFVARGSSDNAAVYGRYLAELASGRPAGLAAPSLHTLYETRAHYAGFLVVAISQSGATPEIVTVCRRLRNGGARTVAIVNDPDSPLAAAVDAVLAIDVGPELAVPATKTVTGQMLAVAAVAAAIGSAPFTSDDLAAMPAAVDSVLADPEPATALAASWSETERLFVVGRGLLYAAALEAALKIKETTGILAEGISAADLRHGPIGVARGDVPVLVLDGGGPGRDDLRAVAELARERGAPVARCSDSPDAELPLPGGAPEALAAFPATVRAQQLALALADARGLEPDTPAGLRKVTPTQ